MLSKKDFIVSLAILSWKKENILWLWLGISRILFGLQNELSESLSWSIIIYLIARTMILASWSWYDNDKSKNLSLKKILWMVNF